MKRKLFFYLVISIFVILQSLLVLLINKPVSYSIEILNLDNYTNKYVLVPKSIDFRPINVYQLEQRYQKTIYNFYFYVDQNYLEIKDQKICLKLLDELIDQKA